MRLTFEHQDKWLVAFANDDSEAPVEIGRIAYRSTVTDPLVREQFIALMERTLTVCEYAILGALATDIRRVNG